MKTQHSSSSIRRSDFLQSLPPQLSTQAVQGGLLQLLQQKPNLLRDPQIQQQLRDFCKHHGLSDLANKETLDANDLMSILQKISSSQDTKGRSLGQDDKIDTKEEKARLFEFFDALDKNGMADSFSKEGAAGTLHSILKNSDHRELAREKTYEGQNPATLKPPTTRAAYRSAESKPQGEGHTSPIRPHLSAPAPVAPSSVSAAVKDEKPLLDAVNSWRDAIAAAITIGDTGAKSSTVFAKAKQAAEHLNQAKSKGGMVAKVATIASGLLEGGIALYRGDYPNAAGVLAKTLVSLASSKLAMGASAYNALISLAKAAIPETTPAGKRFHALLDELRTKSDALDILGRSVETVVKDLGTLLQSLFSGDLQGFKRQANQMGMALGDTLFDHWSHQQKSLKSKTSIKSSNQHLLADFLFDLFYGKRS